MTAGREIAGFVLPFAAGTALSALFPHLFSIAFPHTAALVFTVLVSCLSILLFHNHKQLSSTSLHTLITITALCCGAICAYSSGCTFETAEAPSGLIESLGTKLRTSIRNIPFEDSRTNAIISALISGDRSGLDTDTKNIFRQSGASHILALSGMHLGIIYGILKFILTPLGNSRGAKVMKSLSVMTVCCLYTAMTGAGASIVRALIFIILGECAALFGRSRTTAGILPAAMIIQLTIYPEDIRETGFQLSYAAMAGIAYIFPHLNRLWPADGPGWVSKGLKWMWSATCISIACQLTTGPIAYLYFGTFPKYFILTNLIAAPLVSVIIPYSLAVTALYGFGICPDMAIRLLESIVNILTGSLAIVSSL